MTKPAVIMLLLKRVDCNDGVASYLETVISGLREAGDKVVLVSGSVTTLYGSDTRRKSINESVLDWVVIDGLSKSTMSIANLRRITSLVGHYDVDVISPQGFSSMPISYIAGRITGRAVVANYHPSLQGDQTSSMTGALPAKQRLAFRAVATLFPSDRYIALSRDIAMFFEQQCGIPGHRIHEQVLGVETEFYRRPTDEERRQARRRFGLDQSILVTVLPGRMNLSKGHDVAVAALRLLRSHRPDVESVCLFPGDGDQRARIEADALADTADKSSFRFLGFVEREVLRDSYWAADVVLLPSRLEGFGLVVAEAMCCGAIVIRTPSGGWQDQVIEGKTGFMVPFNDPAALAHAIETVADSPDRAVMREAAMTMAATKFSKARMIEGTSNLYRGIVKARRHSGTVASGAST